MEEIWKTIKENPNYMVSNLGRIKSLDHYVKCKNNSTRLVKGKIFKGVIGKWGYIYIHISVNGKEKQLRLNRLIAIAFIPNPNNKEQVNHLNGNKADNRVENLEWATRSENGKHAYKMGLLDKNKMQQMWDRKKKPVIKIGEHKKEWYESITSAAKLSGNTIAQIERYIKKGVQDKQGNRWVISRGKA